MITYGQKNEKKLFSPLQMQQLPNTGKDASEDMWVNANINYQYCYPFKKVWKMSQTVIWQSAFIHRFFKDNIFVSLRDYQFKK